MRAEILTIGDEILIGQITNTNSVWIAQQLNMAGIKVVHMASVADDEPAIIKAFDDALLRADFVFITGGLGPTKDDITKKTFANYFGAELITDQSVYNRIEKFFLSRGRTLNEINAKQALVPKGSIVFKNEHGTAPGMWMKKNKTVFISMPGVPYEMKGMMQESIMPKIVAEYKLPHIYHKTVLTQGIGESAIAEIIEDWENSLQKKSIKLAYLRKTGMVRLRLSTYGEDRAFLQKIVDEKIEELQPLISKYIFGFENYGEESPTIEKVTSEILRDRKQTISLAESCTGGYVSALFAAIPGASQFFKGAVVPYTNISKHDLLQVDKHLFETVGVVSKECVEQLAQNVRKKFETDFSIAISGIAGPTGGTAEKPVGTVWIAVASATETKAAKFQFGDNRQRNIQSTASAAINMLRRFVLNE